MMMHKSDFYLIKILKNIKVIVIRNKDILKI